LRQFESGRRFASLPREVPSKGLVYGIGAVKLLV
jgi:hypothetical protein